MKILANNPEEFLHQCGEYKDIAITIDNLIKANAPHFERKLHVSDSITILGYLFLPYKNTCYDGDYPIISLAPQKNSLNLYAMLFENNTSFIEKYKDVFGKSNVGKSCIRIKKLNEERIQAIREIIEKANELSK